MELITQTEWAKRHGFSRQYANQVIKKGIVKSYNGKINPKQADDALAAIRNPLQAQKRTNAHQEMPNATQSSTDNSDLPTLLMKTRIKNEIEKGKLLQARAQAEAGELINAEQVKASAFNKARIIRDGMLNIPDRLASVLAAIENEKQIHEMLTKEIRTVLEELSDE